MTKINNNVWTLTFLIALLLIATPNAISECQSCDELNSEISSEFVGVKNPAAVYCTELDYEYKIVKTDRGERGMCVITDIDEEFDAWDFLEGKVGQEYSYCSLNGYDTITVTDGRNSFSSDYAVCVPKKQSTPVVVASSSESMSVTDLMNLGEKVYPKTSKNFQTEAFHTLGDETITSISQVSSSEISVGDIPLSFDWRDVDGQNWVTPVKSQGGCGSCWAFAAVGAVESKINIVMDDSDFDVDLSEQYLVSNCLPGFTTENGVFISNDCDGGNSYYALAYIRDEGITDESCYPYVEYNSLCSDRCSLWDKRLYTIDSFGYTEYMDELKPYLIEYGPMVVYMNVNDMYYDKGIWRSDVTVTSPNHAVLLVGYNNTNDTDGYWIIKNSWGIGYQYDDGYFNVGYGECGIDYFSSLMIMTEDTHYNYPLPLPIPRPTSVPLPTPLIIPDPVPLPEMIIIPLSIPLPFFVPIPFPFVLP